MALLGGGWDGPDAAEKDVDLIVGWEKDGGKRPREVEYTVEVFECAQPPQHGWMPAPGTAGYKSLWQKTYTVSPPEGGTDLKPLAK